VLRCRRMRRWLAGNWLILMPFVPLLVTPLVPKAVGDWVGPVVVAVVFPVFVVMVVRWYRRDRRAERFYRGQCLTCGYSLTGNISGVCPECGTQVAEQ
jgi:hypothetical protein